MSAPDAEALLTYGLRSRTAVIGLVPSTRISTSLGGVFPAIRITLTGGSGWVTLGTWQPSLQWEVWGNNEAEAALIADAVADEADDLAGVYAAGRIVGSWPQGHHFHSPDASTNRQRYIGQIGLLTQP
jgi:hypothetical protein